MTRRAVPPKEFFGDMDQAAFGYLEDLKDAPSIPDLEPLEGISATSTEAEIGAAIAAYVAKVKG